MVAAESRYRYCYSRSQHPNVCLTLLFVCQTGCEGPGLGLVGPNGRSHLLPRLRLLPVRSCGHSGNWEFRGPDSQTELQLSIIQISVGIVKTVNSFVRYLLPSVMGNRACWLAIHMSLESAVLLPVFSVCFHLFIHLLLVKKINCNSLVYPDCQYN